MLGWRGISLEEVRGKRHGVVFEGLTPGTFYSDHLQTSDRKVDCCPPAFGDALERCEAIFTELEAEGALEVELKLDPRLMRGVVALTHGWGNAQTPGMRVAQRSAGVNPNALLPSGPGSFDPLSSQAFMTGIPVELSAL